MPCTHFGLQNAKPYKLSDAGGLFVLMQLNGDKLRRLKYRLLGIERSLSFGVYPVISLAAARAKKEDAKEL